MVDLLLPWVIVVVWMYAGWVLFIFYADVAAHWGELPFALQVLALPALLVGGVLDVSFNWTAATLLFLQLPSTLTLTRRMAKNKAGPDGWRKRISNWVCRYMLDIFQKGHC
jgi:hypothetical protein